MTAPQPSGTVTFLFTDIEGSTTRWEHHRAAMARALDAHNARLLAAMDAHGGFVFKTMGDAFCVAFADPAAALAAALAAQRAIAAEDWSAFAPDFPPLLVRMALHTGPVELRDGDYVGPPVNRVARLMSAAHGGQVLLSLAAQQLVRDSLPNGVALHDLGLHRLRDLRHSEHIFRLVADGLPRVDTAPATAEKLADRPGPASEVDLLPADCPYRGLHAFREADAAFFFGREAFTDLLVESVAAAPMVGVIGPSGSGKSSVVFAGLVPRLRANGGVMAPRRSKSAGDQGSHGWTVVEMRPGSRPYHALAGALVPFIVGDKATSVDRLAEVNKLAGYLRDGTIAPADVLAQIGEQRPDIGRLLLVADQFEELYTLCADDGEQRAFQDTLFAAAFETGGMSGLGRDRGDGHAIPLTLALTLRADFMGHALAYRPFADAIQKHDVKLGPMNRDELARAIRLPAEAQGRAFEHGLVERIADDVGEKAGTLPLLEFALTKLWDHQEGGWLTHAAYEAIGRVEGAVARHADAVYDGLGESDLERARRVFVQLVQPGEGTEDTRRLATRDELGDDWELARKLADARLVTTGRDEAGHETAEVVHEALIRSWGRLREWMNADRRFRAWQERLRFSLRQWEAAGRDEGALLRGVPLAEAEQWQSERGGEIPAGEAALIHESATSRDHRAAAEKERQAQKQALELRAHRLTRAVALLAVAGMLGGLGLAWYANAKRLQSDADALDALRTALIARSQQLLADKRGDEALAVALEAVLLPDPTTDAEVALSEAAYAPGARWEVRMDEWAAGPAGPVALSPDERFVVSGAQDGSVRLFDAGTGGLVRVLWKRSESPNDLDFSPDGTSLAAAFYTSEGTASETNLEVWSVGAGGEPVRLSGHDAGVQAVAFMPNGREIVTAGDDGSVRLWDVREAREIRRIADVGENIQSMDMDPDGRLIVVSTIDGTLAGIDLETGAVTKLAEMGVAVHRVSLSPDGARVAATVTFPMSQVMIVDLQPPFRAQALAGAGQIPTSVAFLPDGRHILVGFNGSGLEVIDTSSQARVAKLVGHRGHVNGVIVDRAGQNAYSIDSSGLLRAWAIYGAAMEQHIGVLDRSRVRALAFDPAGSILAAGSYTGTVTLWDMNGGSDGRVLSGHDDGTVVRRLAFSRDGTRLVSASDDTTARVWHVASGDLLHRLRHGASAVWSAAFISDDTRVLTGDYYGALRIWDSATGDEIRRFQPGRALRRDPVINFGLNFMNQRGVRSAFSTRVADLVALGIEGFSPNHSPVVVWDVAAGRAVRELTGTEGPINQVRIEPDGSTVTAVEYGRQMLRWPLSDPDAGAAPSETYDFSDQVFDLAADAGGRRLALGINNGDVLLWDASRRAVVRRYASPGSNLASIAYSPARSLVARGSVDGTVDVMTVHHDLPDLLRWTLEHRFVRDLTCAERKSIGLPDSDACRGGTTAADRPPSLRDAVATAAEALAARASVQSEGSSVIPTSAPSPASPDAPPSVIATPTAPPADADTAPTGVLRPASSFTVPGRVAVYDMAVRPGDEQVLLAVHTFRSAADHEPRIEAYGIEDGRLQATWRPQIEDIFSLAATNPNAGLFAAGAGMTLRISRWDAPGDQAEVLDIGHSVFSIAATSDGNVVAYGSTLQIGVWERSARDAAGDVTGAWQRHIITETQHAYPAVALHPDGHRLLAAKGDGSLWSVNWREPADMTALLPPDREWGRVIRSVAWSADGRLAAAAGDAGTLTVWDAAGAVRRQFVVGDVTVYAVKFSPDGRHLATSDDGGVVRLYDLASAGDDPVRLLPGHASNRVPIAFVDAGCRLVSADAGEVRVWELQVCRR